MRLQFCLISLALLSAACEPQSLQTIDVLRLSDDDAGLADVGPNNFADAETLDANDFADAGALPDAAELADAGESPADVNLECSDDELSIAKVADRKRLILVAQTNGEVAGEDGTTLRALTYDQGGTMIDEGTFDIGITAEAVEFSLSSDFALAVSESGELVSIDTQTRSVVDEAALPGYGYREIRRGDNGRFYLTARDSTLESGIIVVQLHCDGTFDLGEQFLLRLSDSLTILPDGRGILLGGQAVFDPIDDDDVRLLTLGDSPAEVASFDLYTDFIDALTIDASPDGAHLAIPNGSPFSSESGQVLMADVVGDSITIRTRVLGMNDARAAYFSQDSTTALITRFEPNTVTALTLEGEDWIVADEASGLGLVGHLSAIERGAQSDLAFISSVRSEPQIVVIRVAVPLVIEEVFELGAGIENIPGAIAVAP